MKPYSLWLTTQLSHKKRLFIGISPEMRGKAKSISCAVVRLRRMAHCWRMTVLVEMRGAAERGRPQGIAPTLDEPAGEAEPFHSRGDPLWSPWSDQWLPRCTCSFIRQQSPAAGEKRKSGDTLRATPDTPLRDGSP